MTRLWLDLRHAVRSLAKAPAFTLVCVVSLGIGMAPVIAIPYASRILKMPPAGVKTDGLVELLTTPRGPHPASDLWSYPDFLDLGEAGTGLTLIGYARGQSDVMLPAQGSAKTRASTMFVPADYFRTVGVALARGPGFTPAMDRPLTAEPVVVLGYAFWQNRLGADPDIVGKTLTMDDVPNVVVGIAPDQFTGHLALQGVELFEPIGRYPGLRPGVDAEHDVRADRAREWMHVHARLLPGVSVQQASAAVAAVTARLARQYPATNAFKAGVVEAYDPLGVLDRPDFTRLQAVAFTLTGMVLLVVSLNVSGMMQVRSAMRERELSIRQAIGASRGRLARFLFADAIVLAAAGGALAALVLFNAPSVASWVAGVPIPVQLEDALRIDGSILAICLGLCLLTSLVFGWLPAMRFSRPVILSSLKDDAGSGGRRVGRAQRVAAALQVMIAVPLIVMSGQAIDRVRVTASSPLGFDADLLYAAPLNLDGLDIAKAGFQIRRLRDTLARAGGVASVTVADGLPLDFRGRTTEVALQVDADTAPNPVSAQVTRVGDGYLDTMGIPLLRGRAFTADDRTGAEIVTIVSKPLADRLAPDGDVLGRRVTFGRDQKTKQILTVVGVTADFPTSQMSTEREQLLLPLAQHPGAQFDAVPVSDDRSDAAHVMLIARGAVGEPPTHLVAALENVVRALDPEFEPASVVTGAWLRRNSVNDFLTQSAVAGVAGGVILTLAALGIYGVMGLMVATRTREIAVRAALGASRRRVVGMVILDVVKLVLPGAGLGVVLTAVLNHLNSHNMGLALSDVEPLAYVAGAAVAVLVAVLASLAPARRAASVEPMVAMRSI